jgi:pimeloyl-ACP methyl ester carboxylesterase
VPQLGEPDGDSGVEAADTWRQLESQRPGGGKDDAGDDGRRQVRARLRVRPAGDDDRHGVQRLQPQLDFDASFAHTRRATAAAPLHAMPVVVLSKDRPFDLGGASVPAGFAQALNDGWNKAQNQLAAAMPHARHVVVADSSHYIELERPDLVVKAIRQVVDAFRVVRDVVRANRERHLENPPLPLGLE